MSGTACLHQLIALCAFSNFFLLSLAFSKRFQLGKSQARHDQELDLGMCVWIALHDGIHARHEI